jgi:hypothetical protein
MQEAATHHKESKESIDHPPHYQGCCELTRPIALQIVCSFELDQECIEVIEKYNFSFHVGNALKYLWRADQKGDLVENLQKARWYLDRAQSVGVERWGITIELIDRLINQSKI